MGYDLPVGVEPEASAGNRASWLALVAATGLGVYLCWKMLQPFVGVLLWASLLALVFQPVVRWLERRMPPSAAAALTLVVILLVVIVPVGFLTASLVDELSSFARSAPARLRGVLEESGLGPRLEELAARFGAELDFRQVLRRDQLEEHLAKAGETLVRSTFSFLGGVFGALLQLAFILFSLFFLLRDGPSFVEAVRGYLPLEADESAHLFARLREIVHASVLGVLTIAAIQGTLGGIAFAVLGLPSPLLWGVVMTVLAILPLVGTGLVWGPAALLLAFDGSYGRAAALALFGGLVIGSVDNFLRPRLVGQRAKMHELVIFFSVLGGLKVFGMLGIVLGPVVVATTTILFEVFRRSGMLSLRPAGGPGPPEAQSV